MIPAFIHRALKSFRGELGLSVVALVDQAVVSGTNFAVGIFLARYCAVAEYGAYVLGFACILVINSLQAAVITDPLSYIYPSLASDKQERYAGALLLCQCVFTAFCLLVLTTVVFGFRGVTEKIGLSDAAIGVLLAVGFTQFRELLRRMLFARFLVPAAVVVDFLYSAIVLTGLITVFGLGLLTARTALFSISCGAAAASLLSFYALRGTFDHRAGWRDIRQVLRAQRSFGKWHLLGTIGSYGYMQAQTFILAFLLGTSRVAEVHAARNLVLPVQLLLLGIGNFASPRAARIFARGGRAELNRFITRWGGMLCLAALVYCLVVAVFPGRLLRLFYDGKYSGAEPFVRLWALSFVLFAIRRSVSIGIIAMRRPDIVVLAGLAAGLAALAVCFPAVWLLGAQGSLWARVAAESVLVLVVLGAIARPGIETRPVVKDVL